MHLGLAASENSMLQHACTDVWHTQNKILPMDTHGPRYIYWHTDVSQHCLLELKWHMDGRGPRTIYCTLGSTLKLIH